MTTHPPTNTFSILEDLVGRVRCKPGWSFVIVEETTGLRLVICVIGPDSRGEVSCGLGIRHYFPVPYTTWNERTWRRWIFECCRRVENHELGEWFRDGDERPFAPLHGPGEDPYTIHEFRSDVDARTTQDGTVTFP